MLFSFFVDGFFGLVVVDKAEGQEGEGRKEAEVVADAHLNEIIGDGVGFSWGQGLQPSVCRN